MNKHYYHLDQPGVRMELSTFEDQDIASEFHVMMHCTNTGLNYESQLDSLINAYHKLILCERLTNLTPVFVRFFLSDAANQEDLLKEKISELAPCAVSIVQQPPLDGSKVAMWVFMLSDVTTKQGDFFSAGHNGYTHYWTAGRSIASGNSDQQTRLLLEEYENSLAGINCTIADNCIRTWLFVQNVDVNYAGVVKARKENFATQGLTGQTHYIASTGIEGRAADPNVHVLLDTYAVDGLQKEQVQYLYALSHLSPTDMYGVTFERGVCLIYGDRRQLYISGTASINNKGKVMHPGDIVNQTRRMWENVEMLLDEGGATLEDIMQMIVYLRDASDYNVVSELFAEQFPDTPKQFVLAPVCRPAWLIEMECIATISDCNVNFRNF